MNRALNETTDAQDAVPGPADRATIGAMHGKVLVVEDEPEILEPLSHFLKRAGFTVLHAEDGLTACRIIGSHRPDVILLDILLPDLDGWEVCRLLRQHPDVQVASTPVVMLTALTTAEDKLRGLELGADAYLPKPYSLREVLLLTSNLVERQRRQLELEDRVVLLNRLVEQQHDLHSLLFHELRNQLAVLHGLAQVLNPTGSAVDSADGCVTAIQRSSSYLQDLAEDFLLIRRLQSATLVLPREPLLVHEVVNEMVKLYAPTAAGRGVDLICRIEGASPPVSANRQALKIILSTLLDNSLKYGPAGAPVMVVCHSNDKQVTLEVYDEGMGIIPAEREKIFERFYRGAAAEQTVPGFGLGLYGARVLARALGGNVEVDEQLCAGTCLRVWLPAGEMTTPAPI